MEVQDRRKTALECVFYKISAVDSTWGLESPLANVNEMELNHHRSLFDIHKKLITLG